MALNNPFELDPTGPTSNSNFGGANQQEGCAPSTVNNAIRYLGLMLARATSYQSAAISASVSTNIAADGTGVYIPITGANAINSFGVVAGAQPGAAVIRILEFSSSASLSHGPSLLLRGGLSRKTQPGDVGAYIHEGTADVWREMFFSEADGRGTFGSLSASNGVFGGLTANSASISAFNATSISTSVLIVGGVRQFPRASFRATKGGTNQTSISATATLLTWSTEDWDVGGFFASNAWTPPSGYIRISANIYFTALNAVDNELLTVYLLKNGGTELLSIAQRGGTGPATTTISTIVSVNGTDTISLAAQKGGAGIGTVDGTVTLTYFAGEQL